MAIIITDKRLFILNSTVVLVSFCRQIKGIARELSKFHAIRQQHPRVTQNSCNPHPKEELSLDQAVDLGYCESREFRIIRFGSSIIMRIPHNSHHFSCILQGKEYIEQERKSRKFRVINFCSSLITRILRNPHQFLCFL